MGVVYVFGFGVWESMGLGVRGLGFQVIETLNQCGVWIWMVSRFRLRVHGREELQQQF